MNDKRRTLTINNLQSDKNTKSTVFCLCNTLLLKPYFYLEMFSLLQLPSFGVGWRQPMNRLSHMIEHPSTQTIYPGGHSIHHPSQSKIFFCSTIPILLGYKHRKSRIQRRMNTRNRLPSSIRCVSTPGGDDKPVISLYNFRMILQWVSTSIYKQNREP